MNVKMTESEFQELCDEYGGVCISCGELAYGVEPDARKYTCEDCGEPYVYGAEEALLMGNIQFVPDEDEE